MASSSPPLAPQSVVLGRVALVELDSGEDPGYLIVNPAAPPKISSLTVPNSCIPKVHDQYLADADADADAGMNQHVVALAADPAGLLLHASRYQFAGLDQDIDPPGTFFMARGFIAIYADCLDARVATDVVRIPARAHPTLPPIFNPMRNVGLVSRPGSGGDDYVVAELRFDDCFNGRATLFSFRAGTEAWVEKKVSCFLQLGTTWKSDDVLSHDGMLWWVDLNLGMLGYDPFGDEMVLTHANLPKTLPPDSNPMADPLQFVSKGMVRVSGGRVRFVGVFHARTDPPENTIVSVWTLVLPPVGLPWWELQSSISFASIWESESYVKTGMPAVVPEIMHIDPSNPDIVSFILQDNILSINIPQKKLVQLIHDHIVPPNTLQPLINWRFVLSWDLPRSLDYDNMFMSFDELMETLEADLPDHQEEVLPDHQEEVLSDDQEEVLPDNQEQPLPDDMEQPLPDDLEQRENMEVEPNNVASRIILPGHFQGNQSLELSVHYKYATAEDLVMALSLTANTKWVSRKISYAILSNAEVFLVDSISDLECPPNGCTALISQESWSNLRVDYSKYTTSARPLKERELKEKGDALIQCHEMKGNLWMRRRMHLKNNTRFHLVQWRPTHNRGSLPPENLPTKQQLLKTIEDVAATNIELLASFKEFSTSQREMADAIVKNQKETAAALIQLQKELKDVVVQMTQQKK